MIFILLEAPIKESAFRYKEKTETYLEILRLKFWDNQKTRPQPDYKVTGVAICPEHSDT